MMLYTWFDCRPARVFDSIVHTSLGIANTWATCAGIKVCRSISRPRSVGVLFVHGDVNFIEFVSGRALYNSDIAFSSRQVKR